MFAGHTRPRHAQVLAKEDYGVAMQLAREIEEEERGGRRPVFHCFSWVPTPRRLFFAFSL